MTTQKDAPRWSDRRGRKDVCTEDRRDRTVRPQDSPQTTTFQDFEKYRRAVRRMMGEAYLMSLDFPRRMRFSWRVDRNGGLRCLTDKEVAR